MSDSKAVPLSITFDDGRIVQYRKYFPILKDLGLTASFYIVTSWIGQPGCMSWKEIDDLWKNQNEIGSHAYTQRKLSNIAEAESKFELEKSKDILKRYGCKTLSYPFGEYNDSVLEHAKKHYIAARGYFQQTAVKKNFGYNQNVDDNRYELKVFPMEHAFPSENVSLVDLPLNKFKNMIEEIVNNCVKHGSWGIFVFHGPKARASAKDMINILLRKPLHAIRTVDNISRMTKQSQVEDSLVKFKTFCDLLVSKDRIKVMSVSEVIENLKWGRPHQKHECEDLSSRHVEDVRK